MALKPIYDPVYALTGWFDPTLTVEGWWDDEYSAAAGGPIVWQGSALLAGAGALYADATFLGAGVVWPAEAAFAGGGLLAVDGQVIAAPRETDQGVARNLARNLARRAVFDCAVRVRTEPVPAGAAARATVRAAGRAVAICGGMEAGSDPQPTASASAVGVAAPTGCLCGSPKRVTTACHGRVAASSSGCTAQASPVADAHCSATAFSPPTGVPAGSLGIAAARGIKNPSDEEVIAWMLLSRRRNLTARPPWL